MKIKLDLLPKEYKCERRNYLAIAILIAVVILGLILNLIVFFSMHTYYNIIKKTSKAGLENIKQMISKAKLEKKSITNQLNNIGFDKQKQIELNDKIISFNKIKRGFLWSKFFDELEKVMPKRIWIKNLQYNTAPHFVLDCEAADQLLPIKFEQNLLLKSDIFKNVFLGDTYMDNKSHAVSFKISFDFVHVSKGYK